MPYERRTYRDYSATAGLVSFTVAVKETDLFISASKNLEGAARSAALQARLLLETYITKNPLFRSSLIPLRFDRLAPKIISSMLEASSACNVGPMASVAGAVADYVGAELLKQADEVIVENGGDIFLKISREITVGIFAGLSPLSERIGIKAPPSEKPYGICTSSGTVGPSLSFGKADAVTIKSFSAARADAAATAIGNLVKQSSDIQHALDAAKKIPFIDGALIIKGETLGVWGDIQLVSLQV